VDFGRSHPSGTRRAAAAALTLEEERQLLPWSGSSYPGAAALTLARPLACRRPHRHAARPVGRRLVLPRDSVGRARWPAGPRRDAPLRGLDEDGHEARQRPAPRRCACLLVRPREEVQHGRAQDGVLVRPEVRGLQHRWVAQDRHRGEDGEAERVRSVRQDGGRPREDPLPQD
jgi:hypothetical protein